MILTDERAAGGEIAARKGIAEWTPEGKPNRFSMRNLSRGDGETSVIKVGI